MKQLFVIIILVLIGIQFNEKVAGSAEAGSQSEKITGGETNTEKLFMEGTEIPGTLEKPHVVYVVPWNKTPSAAPEGVPVRRSFAEEILEPVDRGHFQRSITHWLHDVKEGGSK
jgi:hypothetical protein